jgi:hypothetical protein
MSKAEYGETDPPDHPSEQLTKRRSHHAHAEHEHEHETETKHEARSERQRSGGAFVSPPPGLATSFPHPDSFKESHKSGEAHRSGGAFTQHVDEDDEYPCYPVYEDCI